MFVFYPITFLLIKIFVTLHTVKNNDMKQTKALDNLKHYISKHTNQDWYLIGSPIQYINPWNNRLVGNGGKCPKTT